MNQQNEILKREKLKVIDWLVEHFPAAFYKKYNQLKPLKIGIFDDIMDFYQRLDSPTFSKKLLREALNYYSSSPAYLHCQKINSPRIDLFGNEVDLVTEEQARYAQQRYQQRYASKNKSNDNISEQ
ncbi:MAG: ProQ/FINO family protein [Legionella sp.]